VGERLRELVAVAYDGVHLPEEMPFTQPWTDADRRYLGRGSMQYFWRARADLGPQRWAVNFVVRLDGRVIGTTTWPPAPPAPRRSSTTPLR